LWYTERGGNLETANALWIIWPFIYLAAFLLFLIAVGIAARLWSNAWREVRSGILTRKSRNLIKTASRASPRRL
jgi:hypothetical protein